MYDGHSQETSSVEAVLDDTDDDDDGFEIVAEEEEEPEMPVEGIIEDIDDDIVEEEDEDEERDEDGTVDVVANDMLVLCHSELDEYLRTVKATIISRAIVSGAATITVTLDIMFGLEMDITPSKSPEGRIDDRNLMNLSNFLRVDTQAMHKFSNQITE